VEERDRLHLVPALELRPDHASLDHESDEKQKIVARNAEQAAARDGKDGGEKEAGEETGAHLLDAEGAELGQSATEPRKIGSRAQLQKLVVERTHRRKYVRQWPTPGRMMRQSPETELQFGRTAGGPFERRAG
jgi:hypothetical protein